VQVVFKEVIVFNIAVDAVLHEWDAQVSMAHLIGDCQLSSMLMMDVSMVTMILMCKKV
jgi:hypothetical protein